MKNQELIELEFLSILFLKYEEVIDLLQINYRYLENKTNQTIMKASLDCYEKYKTIDVTHVVNYSKDITPNIVIEVISNDLVPISWNDIKKRFMICQITLLENYKKRYINELNKDMNAGKITCDKYLAKMNKISEISILDVSKILTEEEILENVNVAKIGIELKNFPRLNRTLKMVQGDFLIIGAPTATGKSGLLLNLMTDLMDRYQCIYFNMEMSKSTVYKRLIAISSDMPIYCIENPESDYQKELISKAIKEITQHQVVIEHKATYINEIRKVIAFHKKEGKHTIIFLDHVGLIKNDGSKSLYEQTTTIAKQLRQFCLDYDCTIISASQLNRSSYNSEELNMAMLKDSGELENSASKVILLYKNKKVNERDYVASMFVDIVKNRDGIDGKIAYKYDKTKQIFREDDSYIEVDS